ncbi:RNA polymerase subunit sigma-54 (plasmid) [Salipiger sp. H15]|uniref:RNA polymerase sigma-54 factor n=1 Tax=Alloyangia sp. H15 TaxID=3029062 RepID=A0AAU8AS14_9RHOB
MSAGLRLDARQTQTFKVSQLIGVLQMSADELDEHLADAGRDNPMLLVRSSRQAARVSGSISGIIEDTTADAASSLYDHVMRELGTLLLHEGPVRRVVLALIEDLEPSGWLGRPLSLIAQDLGLGEPTLLAALALVQKKVSPAGLFARDLADCLRLQLVERDLWTAEMARVVANLGAMERGGVQGVAEAAALPPARVTACLSAIRRCDPKPGAAFACDPTLAREPDVRVTWERGGWSVELPLAGHRDIRVAPLAAGQPCRGLREARMRARALKHALDLRRSAQERVVRALVDRQGDFFRDGPGALCPLTMAEIAAATGFNPSTVSRVLNGLLIEGPNGMFEARALCAGAASTGAGPSKPRVLTRIRALLRSEDPAAPLTDECLAGMLEAEGLAVSRRVVAKYRQELGLPPAHKRRQRP